MTLTFKLERPDGTPAEPPSFRTSVYRWRSLRVVHVRSEDADQPPALVVEGVS